MNERLWTKKYAAAVLVMFGIYLISGSLLSALAIFAKQLTGQDASAGLMTGLFTIGALAVRFQAGGMVDRFGGRRVILGGIALLIVGSFVLLTSGRIEQAYAARLIQGIGFGVAATATGTYIAGICPGSRLLEGISYTAVAQSLTMVLGPAIGFFLIGPAYDRFPSLFWAAIVIGFGTLALMLLVRDTDMAGGAGTPETGKAGEAPSSYGGILRPTVLLPIFVLFLNALSQSAIASFFALYAISLSVSGIGTFFTINAAGMITSRFIMNRLVRRFGDFPMVILHTIVFGLCILSLTQAKTAFQLMLPAFPAGFAMGSIAPIINTFVIRQLPGNRKGLANALYFSALDLGYALGSIGWGLVATFAGYRSIFFAAALVQAAGLALGLVQTRIIREK